MRAGVEDVGAALVAPETRRHHPVERRHQRGRAVDHRRIDDLALARVPCLEDAADEPESEIEGAAAEIADQV